MGKLDLELSQSLVNEGRFPLKWTFGWKFYIYKTSRNPSLMRAGFHILKMKISIKF